ncbi:hypothetical protein BDN67DRAFT_980255 [Paxillus ammoniavirescens]|nr:hypothetical protein BDN67DRAFT_980255 [Paxillus ammoniavirescens]
MSSSSEEIDPAELQCEEEQRWQEATNKIEVAEEKKAQRDAEKEKKRVKEEAHKKAEEEVQQKAEEEARKQAEEEEVKRKAKERRNEERRTEKRRKKTPGITIIHPIEPKGRSSCADSTKSMGWRPGPESPCGNCTQLDIECEAPGSKKSCTCQQCKISHILCREPGAPTKATKRTAIDLMSPQGGKDWKHRQQKSPDYQEKRSDGEVDEEGEEKEDALGALVEVIVGLSTQYEEERRANAEYREVMTFGLTAIRNAMQSVMRAYLKDRRERQGMSGLDVGFRKLWLGEGEMLGSKESNPKGKGKVKEVEEDDMDTAGDEEKDEGEDVDGEGDVEFV